MMQLERSAAQTASNEGTAKTEEQELWNRLASPALEFKALLRDSDARALRNGGVVREDDANAIVADFGVFTRTVDALIGDDAPVPNETRVEMGRQLQVELLPYLLMSDSAERWYSKPRGYAGDFVTIERYYANNPSGFGRLGPVLDRAMLSLPASVAVRNRIGLLVDLIREVAESTDSQPAKVTSLACGPAREVFDLYDQVDSRKVQTTLLDMDYQALAFVADKRDARGLRKQMRLVRENLVSLASGRRTLDLEPQDLVYSIGLIDYLADEYVVALMNFCHGLLRPGGRLVLGNFHPRNPEKTVMEHLVNWRLIHRTEEDLDRLFQLSTFGRPCTRVLWEQQGINMFGECVRA